MAGAALGGRATGGRGRALHAGAANAGQLSFAVLAGTEITDVAGQRGWEEAGFARAGVPRGAVFGDGARRERALWHPAR
jgi:hypothetical protein